MRRPMAAWVSAGFFVAGPGTLTGLVPWLLTSWRFRAVPFWAPVRVVGLLLIGVGVVVLVHAFVRFVVEGSGTPSPTAPPGHLVVGGLYRHVRNPMYVALLAVVIGQGLLLAQFVLLLYAGIIWSFALLWVRYREEPGLVDRFGDEYRTYRRHVPAWLPRVRPWTPEQR